MTNLWSCQIEVNSTHFASFCSSKTSFDVWDQYIKNLNWAVSSPWLVFLFSCKDLLLMKEMKPPPVASDMGMPSWKNQYHNTSKQLHPRKDLASLPMLPTFWVPQACLSSLKLIANEILNLSHKNHSKKNTCVALKHSFEVDVYPQGTCMKATWPTLPSWRAIPTTFDIKTSFDSSSGVRVKSVLCDPRGCWDLKSQNVGNCCVTVSPKNLINFYGSSSTGDENHGGLSLHNKADLACKGCQACDFYLCQESSYHDQPPQNWRLHPCIPFSCFAVFRLKLGKNHLGCQKIEATNCRT